MFHNEARLAALLNHSGITQVFDLGSAELADAGEVRYIAMEFVHGVNARALMGELHQRKRRMPTPVALRIVRDVCRALHYAHTLHGSDGQPLQIVHRDVSLENILISYSGEVKLADFGIASARNMSAGGPLKGKLEYVPPEALEGEVLDYRADIYSAGVTLYMLVLGRPPISAGSTEELLDRVRTAPPRDPRRIDPDLPAEIHRILLRALEKRPAARFASALELADELDVFLVTHRRSVTDQDLASLVAALVPPTAVPDTPSVRLRWPFERMPTMQEALPLSETTHEQLPPPGASQATVGMGLGGIEAVATAEASLERMLVDDEEEDAFVEDEVTDERDPELPRAELASPSPAEGDTMPLAPASTSPVPISPAPTSPVSGPGRGRGRGRRGQGAG